MPPRRPSQLAHGRVGKQCVAQGRGEVGAKEARCSWVGGDRREGGSGAAGRKEELSVVVVLVSGRNEELGVLVASVVCVTCRLGWFGARGETHAGEEISRVGAARNVDDCESEFSNGVEPARVVVADQQLPVQLLEAGVVRVELEWLVQEIRAEGA